MRRRAAAGLVVLGSALAVLASVRPARAVTCALDRAPAATLLLPYFEVDLDRPDGRTTLFSVNNASGTAVLAQATMWTDQGVPTLAFTFYLTGFDVQTINLRDLFNGVIPQTATNGQDPSDTISPRGDYSQDINFASCGGHLPPPPLPAPLTSHLRAVHTGQFSPLFNGCAGQNLGDHVARGYLTVDTVQACGFQFPSDPGYFGPGGIATNQNVLWGDFFLIDTENGFAQGDNLVRIEADAKAFHPGDATFYGRYLGYSAADAREPLAVAWDTRFVDGGAFSGGTDLLFWRDSGEPSHPYPCGDGSGPQAGPPWYPLALADVEVLDEEENAQTVHGAPFSEPNLLDLFPAESNRTKVSGRGAFPLPYSFGWLYLETGGETAGRKPIQSWLVTLMSATGRWSVGNTATPVLDACRRNGSPSPRPGGL